MYETKSTTWIIGTLAGAALAFGLMVAGDGYVRVAQTIAPYGVDVVQFEPVTVTAQKRAARIGKNESVDTARAAAAGATVGNL